MIEHDIHISKKLFARRESLMLHGLGFITGDPTIKIGHPFVYHPGIHVTVTEPGNSKWLYMMIPVNKGSMITDITITHNRVGHNCRISLIRIVEQKEPNSATVVHNDKLDEERSSFTFIRSNCRVLVSKSILLKVCIDFPIVDERVEFGSVEIGFIPSFEKLSEMEKKENRMAIPEKFLLRQKKYLFL